jgi:prevent-host-death family protein
MVSMRRMSFVQAKARLSELVDRAEHKHQPVLILRHGKPAAAIVPVDLLPDAKAPPPMTDPEIHALWAGFGSGDTSKSAVDDLLESRGPRGPR